MNASTLRARPPELVSRAALTPAERDEMFDLLGRHFDGVTRPQFERDLAEKNWVLAIRRGDRLVGFTTLLAVRTIFENRPLLALYSGDTIMDPAAWNSPALARAWIAAVNRIRDESPELPCYWLLLTSGFRTYRFLPVFWREFFPRRGAPAAAETRRLLDHLAGERYREFFDPQTGIVRFPQPQRLRDTLVAIPPGRTADPDVAFFLARNPGHAQGDELVCLAEISEHNLTAAGRRMVAGT